MIDLDIAEKRMGEFVESHMIDPDGIVYDGINSKTLKPFTSAQTKKHLELHVEAPLKYRYLYLNYEDSIMATSDYLVAQLRRYDATGKSDAWRIVMRTCRALRAILAEGETVDSGFMPKPYGGLKDAAKSGEVSIDQYCKAVLAFHELLEHPKASAKVKADISECIVRMACYWTERFFCSIYFGSICRWTGPHGTAYFLYHLALAYRISRKKIFKTWFETIYATRRDGLTSMACSSGNMGNLTIRSLQKLMKLMPDRKAFWRKVCKKHWKLGLVSIHESGYALNNPPIDDPLKYGVLGVSTLIAANGCAMSDIFGGKSYLNHTREILAKTGQEDRVYYYKLLGKQVGKLQLYKYMPKVSLEVYARKISGYYTAGWLLAYWSMQFQEKE